MKTKIFASIAVMSTLGFLVPMQAQAFGLGKIETLSALNEPFKAEVEITALRADDDINNIIVQLASNKEFERAGLERSFLLTQFKFDIVELAGQTKVVISSKSVVKEPFLDFLLMAKTGSGRLIREYTVLLDPPKNIFPKKKLEIAATSIVTASKKQPEYQYTAPSLTTTDITSYTTERSDTLWHIALKIRPENSVSVHQMMMALLEENPKAFVKKNINGLKAGYTLSIPNRDAINQLSRNQAVNAVGEQNDLWKNRNKKSTTIDIAEDITESSTSSNLEQEQKTTVIDSNTAVVADEVTARLQLVVPDELLADDSDLSPLGDKKLTVLSEQLTLAQETIEGQTQENIEINSRMDVMEEQIQTLRRLISLKDADLARLQSLLEEEQEVSLENLSEEAIALVQESEKEQQEALSVTNTVDEQIEEPVGVLELADISSLDDAIVYAAELSGVDNGEIQTVMNKIKTFVAENRMESMLGALLILLLLWLIIRHVNRPGIAWSDAVETVEKKANDLELAAVVISEEHAEDTGNDEEEVSVVDIEPGKTVEDLINDADVYVNYDDLTNAKLVLEQARSQEPSNELVLQKLLHVLYKQQHVDEFVSLAENNQFDKKSLAWAEIVNWGRKLAPTHILFKQEEIVEVVGTASDESETLDLNETFLEIESSELEFKLDGVASSTNDEILSVDDSNNDEELLQIDTLKLDEPLSLDITSEGEELTLDDAPLVLDSVENSSSIELEELDDIAELDKATETISKDEDNDLAFDLDFDDIDEVATKLDLASAYVDMGDADGARSILNEVLSEGNDEQKMQAKTLLEQLS
ncbi:MAG: hypothetical protein HRT92_10185 [Piscirickettsiaceae bacterium]|nr:hypothetical protein [Piscirickettsiaceae bacterium]